MTDSKRRPVVLLGPQDETPTLNRALEDLNAGGSIATVTAGWEQREIDDTALSEHLGGRAKNLGLHARAEALFGEDGEVRELLFERYDRLRELAELYRLRLGPALDVCRALLERADPADLDALHGPEVEDAIEAVRALDAHHLARTSKLDEEIHGRIGDRDSIQRHTDELSQVLSGVDAICVAGGHVGILLNRLRLFRIFELSGPIPIVAWSGGAMVLSERIVLFHDSPPQGAGDPEVYASGLGLVRGVVPLPHASGRLRLDDAQRVALFSRRFAPALCAAMDGGETLIGEVGSTEWKRCDHTLRLTSQGGVA